MAMMHGETVMVAFDALRANKVRAFLTMLGVIIGSASIVLVVTVALTGRQFVLGQIESIGSNLVYATNVVNPGDNAALSYGITLADVDAVRRGIPQVAEAAGTLDMVSSVVVHGKEYPVTLIGVTRGYQTIRNLVILRGRYFDNQEVESRNKVCLVTQDLANRVYPNQDVVGLPIQLGEFRFTIIGVFKERVATYGLSEIQRESALMPFLLIKNYAGTGQDTVRTLYAQARTPEDVPTVTRQVGEVLRSRHPAGAVYDVQNLESILQTAKSVATALTIVLLIIGFIALLISGIGIMNIMLVTVTERTREIGIRKAIGATRREILAQFLLEAFLISGFGSVAGILLGVGIPVLAQTWLPGNLRVPISSLSVILAFGISCATGLFFGYLPANKAAMLQPTESLRYE
jgi:putative ABC transport system permease protein